MNFPLLVASRYLFSKKSTNAINVISVIAMSGMAIGTMVLVLLLSVFNGFENTILKLYNSFYPDLIILPAEGKTFSVDHEMVDILKESESIAAYTEVLNENVYLEYDDNDYIGTLKGVDMNYRRVTGIDSFVVDGDYMLADTGRSYAYVGSGIAIALNLSVERNILPVKVHVPRRGKSTSALPQNAFRIGYLYPSGVFNLQQEINNKYVITDIDFVRSILEMSDEVSSIEIKLKDGKGIQSVKNDLQEKVGPGYMVKTKFQQQASLYSVMKTEKWTVFALLTFIMFVISFNILGALSMLVLEKKKDVSILKSLGASDKMIHSIFFLQGTIMSLIGGIGGIVIGLFICVMQIKFGIIRIPGSENFIIDAYPVKIEWQDIVLVLIAVLLISAIASWLPSRRATKAQATFREA
ncbi:MAG: ABC transporter permease [Chitinophagales bacterium]|nr:ABC transporter permease [Chitinophagales bacterium]